MVIFRYSNIEHKKKKRKSENRIKFGFQVTVSFALRMMKTILKSIHYFMLEHHDQVIVFAICIGAFTAYFHLQLHLMDRDLNYWTYTIRELYNTYETLFIITSFVIFSFFVIIVTAFVMFSQRFVKRCETMSRLEIRKRYADFLFIRLVSEINKIKHKVRKDNEMVSASTILKAHEDIKHEIDEFKEGVKKILTPNPEEFRVPPEDYYDMDEEEYEELSKQFSAK